MSSTILDAPVRSDLADAHREAMHRIAEPGTWWTGAERLAIAAETRRAAEFADLPPWQSPSATAGMIRVGHPLPPGAVDVVWRVGNHPGTLTIDWYHAVLDGLPTPQHYVELVGIVAAVTALDRTAHALGFAPIPLPAAQSGEPTRAETAASVTSHWVPTTEVGGARVLQALSGVPGAAGLMNILSDAQYVPAEALTGDLAWSRGSLSRLQVELVAAQTSLVNECFY